MILILILLISLISVALIRESPLNYFSDFIFYLHNQCLKRLPDQSKALPELKAIVCGENFPTLNSAEIFIAAGLIHLFVVSGAHLIILKKIFDFINKGFLPEFVFIIFIIIYSAACNFNPPILRSLLTLLISAFFLKEKTFWPNHFKLLVVGLVSLLMNFYWLKSLSLQMSWIISFVLIFNSEFAKEQSLLVRQSLYLLFLSPVLVFLQIPNFLIVLTNLFFSAILEFILFPLGILTWLFPFTYTLFDICIDSTKWILKNFEFNYVHQNNLIPPHFIEFIWFYIGVLHLIFHLFLIFKSRKSVTL